MSKECLTREELTERLKAIAKQETIEPISGPNAMCYSPRFFEPVSVKCDSCGNDIKTDDEFEEKLVKIKSFVKNINQLTFRAKIQCVCKKCATKLGFENEIAPIVVFYFKAKGDKDFRLAISEDPDDYEVVESFLVYNLVYNKIPSLPPESEGIIKGNIDVIERMTGISVH